jgi:hypothetical protein
MENVTVSVASADATPRVMASWTLSRAAANTRYTRPSGAATGRTPEIVVP